MGIKIINPYLQSKNNKGLKKIKLNKYNGKVVVIDVSNFLFRYLYSQGDKYLIGFLMIFDILVSNNIYPIFCFDGLPPLEKSRTLRKRQTQIKERQKRNVDVNQALKLIDEILTEKYQQFHENSPDQKKINENEFPKKECEEFFYELLLNGNKPDYRTITISEITKIKEKLEDEMKKNHQKCTRITKKIIDTLKEMFDIIGIKYIHSKDQIEADLVCTEMVKQNIADIMITDDLDPLALGCPKTLRDFTYDINKEPTEYNLDEIIKDIGLLSYEQFVDICLICGTDYTTKITQIKNIDDLDNIIISLKRHPKWNDKLHKLIRDNYLMKYEPELKEKSEEEMNQILNKFTTDYISKKRFFIQSFQLKDMIKDHNLNNQIIIINNNYERLSSFIKEKCQDYRSQILSQVINRINKSYTQNYRNKFNEVINNSIIQHFPDNLEPNDNLELIDIFESNQI